MSAVGGQDLASGESAERQRLERLITDEIVPRREEFIEGVAALMLAEIRELPDDAHSRELLSASVAENTDEMISILWKELDPRSVDLPPAAVTYALALARGGVPLTALLRAYRLAQTTFTAASMEVIAGLDDDEMLGTIVGVVERNAIFVDHISVLGAEVYERERTRLIATRAARREQWIERLLAGEPASREAESALEYPLSEGTHLAVVAWIHGPPTAVDPASELARVHASLQEVVGPFPSLVSAVGEHMVRIWFNLGAVAPPPVDSALAAVRTAGPRVRAALGEAAGGVEAVRRSYHRARTAHRVAVAPGSECPVVTCYSDLGALALAVGDLVELRAFVGRVLGALAGDDLRRQELRETLRVFLEANCSYTAASERLAYHRNTIHYRVQQAVAELPPGALDRPLDVSLALEAARWLGADVLD